MVMATVMRDDVIMMVMVMVMVERLQKEDTTAIRCAFDNAMHIIVRSTSKTNIVVAS